jgi:hypothetical protein
VGRLYRYVGPPEILARAAASSRGTRIQSASGLEVWSLQKVKGLVGVTFVVDEHGSLLIADRRSEHVACASGRPVLSAGEMFVRCGEVVEISNQSTGYCPEPESWPAVAAALDRAGIAHPGRFTHEVIFRRCTSCGERSIVKDGWFVCGICGGDLPAVWNF